MKTLYLDIFSGISGDMFIGAMLDLGVDLHSLEHELEKLGLDEFHLHASRKSKSTIEGVKFDVHLEHDHDHDHDDHHAHEDDEDEHHHEHHHDHDDDEEEEHHHHHSHSHSHHHHHENGDDHDHDHQEDHDHVHGRDYETIRRLLSKSHLSDWVKEKSAAVFHRIALAEGKIHGQPPEKVHFHEVGAVDSIVDIVGACICLELLGKPRVLASPVVDGTGWIRCAHGRFPIPAPATLNILSQRAIPITQCEEPHELVTPTGAALLAEFVEEFGPLRQFAPEKIGFGLGERDNKTRPNVLRVLLGESTIPAAAHMDWEQDTIAVLETNLDDSNSEILGYVIEKAFAQGALDAFHIPIQMKKNRPGVLLSILCAIGDQDKFTELLLRETTALGVRRYTADRRKLRREVVRVNTPWGEVEVKTGTLNGKVVQASPEYESCRAIANARGVPLKEVYAAALAAYHLPYIQS